MFELSLYLKETVYILTVGKGFPKHGQLNWISFTKGYHNNGLITFAKSLFTL